MGKSISDIKHAYARQARHEKNREIHEAYELEKLGYGENDRWICIDERCGAEMTACAWRKDVSYKVSPYFRVEGSHTKECFVVRWGDLARKGKKKRISGEQGFPLPYPSKVIFTRKKFEISDSNLLDDAKVGTSKHYSGRSVESSYNWHNRTRPTIWEPCEFYVDFPYDRHLPLQVQGCDGQTYDEVFVRLGPGAEKIVGSNRIFYDQIMFKSQYDLEREPLELKLLSTVNLPGGERHNRQLSIHTDGWVAAERQYLRQQIAEAMEKGSKAYREEAEERPWIFFVGSQENYSQVKFRVESYPAIKVLFCKMPRTKARRFRQPYIKPIRPRPVPPLYPQQSSPPPAKAPSPAPTVMPSTNSSPYERKQAPVKPPDITPTACNRVNVSSRSPRIWVRISRWIAGVLGAN